MGCKSQFFKYRHGQLWLSQRLWLLSNSKIDHFLVVNRVQWYQLQPVLSRSSLRGFLVSLTPAVFVTHRYGAEYSSFERQLAVYSIRGGSEGKGVEAVALPIFFFFLWRGPAPSLLTVEWITMDNSSWLKNTVFMQDLIGFRINRFDFLHLINCMRDQFCCGRPPFKPSCH